MPVLAVNQPIESPRPNVVVENALTIGGHRFTLTVVDDSGLESAADLLIVEVRRSIIDPVLPPVVAPPPVILRPPPIRAPQPNDAPTEPSEDEPPR